MPVTSTMRFQCRKACRNLSTLLTKPKSAGHHALNIRTVSERIEEARLANDRLKYFHPTCPGQVLDGRFRTVAKLGYGSSSTVWLAEYLEYSRWKSSEVPQYVTIKIAALDTDASREQANAKLNAKANTEHEGYTFMHLPRDVFKLQGPQGMHTCLVYEPMRETCWQLQRRMPDEKLPLRFFKLYMYCLLQALDYLHTECHLIHTDIKDDNVLFTFENESVLKDFAIQQKTSAQYQYVEDGHATFASQADFGPLRGTRLLPRLADFNLCFPGPNGSGHFSAIQSHYSRAPEVLLGLPWTYSVDIWNFGIMMWDLLEDRNLFDRPTGDDGEYDAHVHLTRMVRRLGEPPEALIQRERHFRGHKLPKPILNFKRKECHSRNQFWGGPFFDHEGRRLRGATFEGRGDLESTVTQIDGDDKKQFLDFAGRMLEWLPEKRASAKELLKHEFFDSLMRDRERFEREDE